MGKIQFNINQLAIPGKAKNEYKNYKGEVKETPPVYGLMPKAYGMGEIPRIGQEVIHSQMEFNVRKKGATEWIPFPLEPVVSVSSKNVIVRRNVAKAKEYGTIKERWSQDDFEVTIEGYLTNIDEKKYPSSAINQLLELFRERQEIEVAQEMLVTLGINFLAIQSITFPHTQGINNQKFVIKAYSDTQAQLLIET